MKIEANRRKRGGVDIAGEWSANRATCCRAAEAVSFRTSAVLGVSSIFAEAISTGLFKPRTRARTECSCAVPVTRGSRKSGPASAHVKIDASFSIGCGLRCRQSDGARHFQQALYFGVSLHQKVIAGTRKLSAHGGICRSAQGQIERANLDAGFIAPARRPIRLRSVRGSALHVQIESPAEETVKGILSRASLVLVTDDRTFKASTSPPPCQTGAASRSGRVCAAGVTLRVHLAGGNNVSGHSSSLPGATNSTSGWTGRSSSQHGQIVGASAAWGPRCRSPRFHRRRRERGRPARRKRGPWSCSGRCSVLPGARPGSPEMS